jgi:ABC-type glycerol-3-phosphate transport system substrate-binding protein
MASTSRREYIATLAVTVGGVVAAACAPAGTPEEQPPAAVQSSTQPMSLVKQPTTIEVAHPAGAGHPYEPAFNALISRLPTHSPNLKVTSNVLTGDLVAKVLALASAGTFPDVAATFVLGATVVAQNKLAAPLAPLLRSVKEWSVSDFFEGMQDVFTHSGDFILAPVWMAPAGIGINLDMLDRASLRPPAANWTWDNFAEYAVKLTQREGDQIRVFGCAAPDAAGSDACEFFGSAQWAHGGDWVDSARTKVTFQQPEGIAALERWVDLAFRQRALPMNRASWEELGGAANESGAAVGTGRAAMAYMYSSNVPQWQRAIPSTVKWTTVQMPRQKQGGAHTVAFGWYVLQGSKNKDAAAEFIRVATLPEELVAWSRNQLSMPTRKSAALRADWAVHLRENPLMQAFNDSLSYARAYPPVLGWSDVISSDGGVGQQIQAAREGKVSARQALEEAARLGDNILERARAAK